MPPIATLLALITLALWSVLAYLSSQLSHVPPILSVGIALSISGILGIIRIREWQVNIKTLAVGVGGIFGYHFLYFTALQNAPPIETSLINYLWPLLIVILSPLFLHGYILRPYHIIGAFLGFLGAALIATGGQLHLDIVNLKGYLYAAAAAFTWSGYSLLTKRLPRFPTGAIGIFCLVSGVLSLLLSLNSTTLNIFSSLSHRQWLFLLILGIGPMGLAFYTWDAALKRGDARIIGSLAYLTPLLSTLILVLVGGRQLTWISAGAMILIVSGAVTGSFDLIKRKV